eukprot:TRINITY_DN49058_c0_g1_i1.p1 TRINITY_DN49058_c0_g1~~TRINITY_DN49058_c0_g1_i1.p1  ORF type:complete len:328 (-),score=73.65 TRINITY_DN49058_c0_g1_i1:250-1188(-)
MASEVVADEGLNLLFDRYGATEEQQRLFFKMKKLTNMPAIFHTHVNDEQMLWAVLVGSAELSENPTASDINFCERKIEERLRNLEEAELRFKWFSAQWTKALMRQLIRNWFCGYLVICPELSALSGSPIQFVHEYYGNDIDYPLPEGQTEEWKQFQQSLYVLMARSTCLAYPMATAKGIVSFSDMQDFDWTKYDMESKNRNSDITQLVPNRLARMITFHPDEKMIKFYEEMGARARKKWGFEQYATLAEAVVGEQGLLPEQLPSFVGGTYKVDVVECLKYLFRREPEALALMEESFREMEAANEIPKPQHME